MIQTRYRGKLARNLLSEQFVATLRFCVCRHLQVCMCPVCADVQVVAAGVCTQSSFAQRIMGQRGESLTSLQAKD